MSVDLSDKKLFALWEHMAGSGYTFLGGNVTAIDSNGRVQTKEYGSGYFFKPAKILPQKEGQKLLYIFNKIRSDHESALKNIQDKYDSEFKALKKNYGL